MAFGQLANMIRPEIPAASITPPIAPSATPPQSAPEPSTPPIDLSGIKKSKRGGLPLDVIIAIQRVYMNPTPQPGQQNTNKQNLDLNPGWGGQGQ
jgi:hypothetical protein